MLSHYALGFANPSAIPMPSRMQAANLKPHRVDGTVKFSGLDSVSPLPETLSVLAAKGVRPLRTIEKPLAMLHGNDAMGQLPEVLNSMGIDRIILYTGSRRGVHDQLEHILRQNGISIVQEISSLSSDVSHIELSMPSLNSIDYPRRTAIIGLGGGLCLDNARYAAHKLSLPFVSFPTTPSTDSMVSPIASLNNKMGVKTSFVTGVPHVVVMDYGVLGDSADILKYAGIGDIVAKFTAIQDWQAAARKSDQLPNNDFDPVAAMMGWHNLEALMAHPNPSIHNPHFMRLFYNTLLMAGYSMEIAGQDGKTTRRVAGGSEHMVAAELEKLDSKGLHGIHVGVASYIMAAIQGDDETFQLIKCFLEKSGFFDYISQGKYQLNREHLEEALVKAANPESKPNYHIILQEPGKLEQALQFVATDPILDKVLYTPIHKGELFPLVAC